MKTSKIIIGISAVLFGITAIALYIASLFEPTIDPDFTDILLYLKLARCFALISILFIIWFVVICKQKSYFLSIEKIFALFAVVIYIGIAGSILIAAKSENSVLEMWSASETEAGYARIEKFLPFNKRFEKDSINDAEHEVVKISADGIMYICATNEINYSVEYIAEYFESSSPLLNWKFDFERTELSVFNNFNVPVMGDGVLKEINGVKYNLYAEDDNYVITINSSTFAYYSSLTDASKVHINIEEFESAAIKQFEIMQHAASLGYYKW